MSCKVRGGLYYTGMRGFIDKVICGDRIEVLRGGEKPFADLVFADPPFNIGVEVVDRKM